MEIRSANPSDFPMIAAVWRESALQMDGSIGVPSEQTLLLRIIDELSKGWQLQVAVDGENVIAMLAIIPKEMILDQLFVLPSHQGFGVGSALLAEAKCHMPRGFSLRTSATNLAAHRFYQKRGLNLLRDGLHPRNGSPVRYFQWVS